MPCKPKPRDLPKHVYRKPWGIYWAKGGRKPYIRWRGGDDKASIESPAFDEWYARCKRDEGNPPQGDVPVVPPEPVTPQTFRWLCVRYYKSVEFMYRDKVRLDSCCQEPLKSSTPNGPKFADIPLKELTLQHLKALRDRKVKQVGKDAKGHKVGGLEAANNRVRSLRRLCAWAREEYPQHFPVNIGLELKRVKNPSKGWKPWDVADLEAYEARHPIGTQARLTLEILKSIGCAREDVVTLGNPYIFLDNKGRKIVRYARGKNDNECTSPLPQDLLDIIAATKVVGKETWLVTEYGKPFSPNGFGNKFREWCLQAGVLDPKKRMHGLRKVAATRDAERPGASAMNLCAKYGWMTLAIAQKYIETANRRRLGAALADLA